MAEFSLKSIWNIVSVHKLFVLEKEAKVGHWE